MFLSFMKNSMGRKWKNKNYNWEKIAKNYFIGLQKIINLNFKHYYSQ